MKNLLIIISLLINLILLTALYMAAEYPDLADTFNFHVATFTLSASNILYGISLLITPPEVSNEETKPAQDPN